MGRFNFRGRDPRQFITNMQVEMPLPRKLWLLARNLSLRVIKLQDCCGHYGEPGC